MADTETSSFGCGAFAGGVAEPGRTDIERLGRGARRGLQERWTWVTAGAEISLMLARAERPWLVLTASYQPQK